MSQGITLNLLLWYTEIIHFPHLLIALLPHTNYTHKHTHTDIKSAEQIISYIFRVAQRRLLRTTDPEWKAADFTLAFNHVCHNSAWPPKHGREWCPLTSKTTLLGSGAGLGLQSSLSSLFIIYLPLLYNQDMVLTVSGTILSPPVLSMILCCPFLFASLYFSFCCVLFLLHILDCVLKASLSVDTSSQEDLLSFFRAPIIPQPSCIMLDLFLVICFIWKHLRGYSKMTTTKLTYAFQL